MAIGAVRQNVQAFLLYTIFLFLPYYAGSSGGIQPVDVFIFFACLYYIFLANSSTIRISHKITSSSVLIFLLFYQLLVLLCHAIFSITPDTWILTLFNFYYICLLLLFYNMFKKIYELGGLQKLYNTLLNAMLISLAFPFWKLITRHAYLGGNFREALSFNDPNQIVFFCLLQLSILFYLSFLIRKRGYKLSKIKTFIILNFDLLMLYLSVSRSGLLFLILYAVILIWIFEGKATKRMRVIYLFFWIFFAILMLCVMYFFLYKHFILVRGNALSLTLLENDLFLRSVQGVGDKLVDIPYFLFGSGVLRREVVIGSTEYHNNFIGILNQTGVIALILYTLFCITSLIELAKKSFFCVLPFALYIITSLSLFSYRSRFMWAFLAFTVFFTKIEIEAQHRYKQKSKGRDKVGILYGKET